MADDYLERDFDDEVYEDDYYDEHYDEEELEDYENSFDEDEEDDEELAERKIHMSYACEECDYRWDDVIIKRKDDIDDTELDAVCPMCGSMNVTQI